jgi:hypothetical protein
VKVTEWTSVMLKASVGPVREGKLENSMDGGNDFRKPKQYLGSPRIHNNEEVEITVREEL